MKSWSLYKVLFLSIFVHASLCQKSECIQSNKNYICGINEKFEIKFDSNWCEVLLTNW